jgi:ribonuclease BN (tRNA processing enzyme)
MRAVILGAGTSIPARGYSPAGVYVQIAKEHVLLDAGAGSLQRLQRVSAQWDQLDRIFLTHFHVDHSLDLVSILAALRLPPVQRKKPLYVYGPPGLKRLYRQFNAAYDDRLSPRGYRVVFRELQRATQHLPGYTVHTYPMNHYATKAIGYRLTQGRKTLAYSGDTDVCDNASALGQGAEVFILECSVRDDLKFEGHLTPSECGQIAARARCRHLVLSHFYPVFKGYDIRARVRRHYPGRLTLARDFTRLIIS